MAKIPLRVYIKDIESLIEHGEIEQAVSNAKSILKTYPKHIDTYRLLGKAFLESQRYAEAADILQRILSVIPDDFFSQIGMSIIREDEGNLDAAIWHMERAYEVQPFNPAVQDELRRLYGRRDGVEPPKIRLTRGALIRMYTRGELYPQAIAETRAALAEDPQRADLRVLLARLYFLSGHKNDAAGICSEIIGKLPYCLEANRLLSQILPGTSRAEEARKFQQRIFALDPYEAFISPTAPTSDLVPDQAVMIEPGEESEASSLQAPAWANTVGVQWDEQSEDESIPDWLNTLEPAKPSVDTSLPSGQTELPPASPEASIPMAAPLVEESGLFPADHEPSEGDEVPGWMKEAGWSKSERNADDIMAEQGDNPASDDEISPAEIPDWIKSIAPQDEETAPEGASKDSGSEWYDNLLASSPSGAGEEAAMPTQAELEAASMGITGDMQPEETLTAPSDQSTGGDLPDWLSRISEVESSAEPPSEPSSISEPIDLPDWTQRSEPSSEQQEVISPAEESPDWLKSLEEQSAIQPAGLEQQAEEISAQSEAPNAEKETLPNTDWLNNLEPRFETTEPDQPVSERVEPAVGAEGLPEEPAAQPPIASETLPPPMQAIEAKAEAPAEPMDFSDTDAMMAWLESLAAKQGADEATLITPPEQRTETPPEWVRNEIENSATPDTLQQVAADNTVSDSIETPASVNGQNPESAVAYEPSTSHVVETPIEEAQPTTINDEEAVAFNLNDEDASMAWMGKLTTPSQDESSDQELPAEDGVEDHSDLSANAAIYQTVVEPTVENDLHEIEPEQKTSEPQQTIAGHIDAQAEGDKSSVEPTQPVKVVSSYTETATPEPENTSTSPTASMSAMPDYNDTDAMIAWLESLAAKQGADEATLMTPPDQRTETPPEWVKNEIEKAHEEAAVAPVEEINKPTTEDPKDLPDWLKNIEVENEPEPLSTQPLSTESTDDIRTAWAPEVEAKEPATAEPESGGHPTGENLQDLHLSLQHGEIDKALQGYAQHIHNGEHLDETIQSLRDALYRHPVDINIWQTLGDALARNNQLQEALDAYTKAEELLR